MDRAKEDDLLDELAERVALREEDPYSAKEKIIALINKQ